MVPWSWPCLFLSPSPLPAHHAYCRVGLNYDPGDWPLNWVIVLIVFSSILNLSLWHSFITEPIVFTIFSYFLYSWCSSIYGLTALGETAPPRAHQFVEIAKGWTGSVPLLCKVQSRAQTPKELFYPGLTHQANILAALNHPSDRCQAPGDSPYAPKLAEIFETNQSPLPIPVSSFQWKM